MNLRNLGKRKTIKPGNINALATRKTGQGWSLYFLSNEVVAEKKTRILSVLNAYSRKCLLVVALSRFKAKQLVTYLEQMVLVHGQLQHIRCDNGPEMVGDLMMGFGLKHGIEIRYTQPGKPMQHGLVERLNGTVRATA